jgi:hypothetical protein
MTSDGRELTMNRLRTPRAAAIAGILFALLLTSSILLLHFAVPGDPSDPEALAGVDPDRVKLALHLVPFVGIAFLWFVGVLRDRLSHREDRLFATVFLGSALLFLAMLFAGAAVMGSIIATRVVRPPAASETPTFVLARQLTSNIINIYAIKMAAVFMCVTSTLVLRTAIAPRWFAYAGFALSLPLLFGSRMIDWGFLVFPAWVLLVSVHVLVDNLRRPRSP